MSFSMRLQYPLTGIAFILLGSVRLGWASPPDAGQVLQQQQQQVPQPPREAPALDIRPAPLTDTSPGGQQVVVVSVTIAGNSVFSAEALQAVLGDVVGRSYDLGGLRGLANRISEHYRANGYPFARAFLPAQSLDQGLLRIDVVEGRYGRVRALGEDVRLVVPAQAQLGLLQPGTVIGSQALERVTLLLDDLPGIRAETILRPGEEAGTGDLDVQISRDQPVDGSLDVDNQGNRYTGYYRLRTSLNINSPFRLGDQILLSGMGTKEELWMGAIGYQATLGVQGLRGIVTYTHTQYVIGKELADSNSQGKAAVTSAGLSYSLLRSREANTTLSVNGQHKRVQDSNLAGTERRRSNSLLLSLQFDVRDSLGNGGLTFGSVTWTRGRVELPPNMPDPLDTQARFNKINLDLARVQGLAGGFSLYGRFSSQSANHNLESSEGMSVDGPSGVRAYPTGEASGDEGWLTQLELRYTQAEYTPYVFFDQGRVRVNEDGSGPRRTLAGYGVGLRYQRGNWRTDLALAWRERGGRPADANEPDSRPRVWLSAGYHF